MPVKVKVNTDEENDVKQIAQVIGEVLNRKVFVKRGENEYKDEYVLYLKEPASQQEHSIAFLAPKKDETTGDLHYTVRLLFDALKLSEPLKDFKITGSKVGQISFILELKKQSSV